MPHARLKGVPEAASNFLLFWKRIPRNTSRRRFIPKWAEGKGLAIDVTIHLLLGLSV